MEILENGGCFSSREELEKFAKVAPLAKVCAKFGCSQRICLASADLVQEINKRLADNDYIREIYFNWGTYDKLCEVFGESFQTPTGKTFVFTEAGYEEMNKH